MQQIIRQASADDKKKIAKTIANSYSEELSVLSKNQEKLAAVFEQGLHAERFWIWIEEEQVLGIAACSDNSGRAFTPDRKSCIKNFGWMRGLIASFIFKSEFAKSLPYPKTTGYIEFVGVHDSARGRGISKEILHTIIKKNEQYDDFLLDVMDNNTAAIKTYEKLGFREYKREPFRGGKNKGIKERIYMKFSRI